MEEQNIKLNIKHRMLEILIEHVRIKEIIKIFYNSKASKKTQFNKRKTF